MAEIARATKRYPPELMDKDREQARAVAAKRLDRMTLLDCVTEMVHPH
jgi:hypothetical protein